ncbi:hypothetical protein ABPG73_020160 [Tetrahymena malaccensis]
MKDHFGIGAFLVVLIIIVQSVLSSYFSQKHVRYFHETGIAIILGMIASIFSYYILDYEVKLERKIFVYIFLPAIVFAEGYSLKKKIFFHNIMYIFIYGFLGTIITFSFLVISMNYLCENDLIIIERGNSDINSGPIIGEDTKLNSKEIILFSAALSSKDSFIASTMVNHHTFPTLFHIIFGEGIMNDATSLILFESFQSLIEHEQNFTWDTIPDVFIICLISLGLSIFAGMFFGILCTLLLKHFSFLNQTVIHEILLIFMCSYSGYCIIEYFNLSGVISLLVSGFIIGYYGFHNLSDKAKICANVTFQTISCGAENFLFAFVGFTTFSFYTNAWSFSLIGWILLILIVSRIFQVFVMSAIFRLFYRKTSYLVKFREQLVICFTGISRGILGFILMDQVESKEYQDLLNSTMIGVLIITTLLFGFVNPKLIDCVLPPKKYHEDESIIDHGHKIEQESNYDKQNKNEIENFPKIEAYKVAVVQAENNMPKECQDIQIRQSQIEASKKVTENADNFLHADDELSNTNFFITKKYKIELLLKNSYDEKLFKSKIYFKFSRFNEKYLKPFLIRDYQSKLDEFILSSRLFREDKIQLTRPMGKNKNEKFIQKSVQKLKNTIKMAQSQRRATIYQKQQDKQPEILSLQEKQEPISDLEINDKQDNIEPQQNYYIGQQYLNIQYSNDEKQTLNIQQEVSEKEIKQE